MVCDKIVFKALYGENKSSLEAERNVDRMNV